MKRILTGSLSGALIAVALMAPGAASAASPPAAFVRIEGSTHTLLAQRSVQTNNATQIKGNACPGTSAAGALDVATHGNWSGEFSSSLHDYSVITILGEAHPFSGPDYWSLWVNGTSSSSGACSTALHTGDRVLWFPCLSGPPPAFACLNNPLELTGPASARVGRPVKISISQLDGNGGSKPFTGATVSGPGVNVAAGHRSQVTITPSKAGTLVLQARKSGATPSDPLSVCVYAVRDGSCGTADRDGPPVHVIGIKEHQHFTARHAPRELRGTAGPVPSGLRAVRISLHRRASNGSCSFFDGNRGTWRAVSCHSSQPTPTFSVGAHASWSYLLPARLSVGGYRLRVVATDGNRKRTRAVTGVSQIDFSVTRR